MQKSKKTKDTKVETKLRGVLSVNRRATGYLPHEKYEEDIEIAPEYLHTALNGDEVEIELLPKRSGRLQGKVVGIIERAQTEFVGTLEQDDGRWFVAPDERRMYADIALDTLPDGAAIGDKLHVRITSWGENYPHGEVLEVIGKSGEHETEMRAIVLAHGFHSGFPKDVEQEAKNIATAERITKADIASREDFRAVPTITIDPQDAKDFDDALSLQTNPDGTYEIGIHIADVAHYVRPGSALDKEARKRATSIYLVDRTIPMLPEDISNDVCSLMPNEDRLAFSAIFTLDKNACVLKRRFGRTVIHSDKRFSYREAQDVFDAGDGPFVDELTTLITLARTLREERFKSGSVQFSSEEVRFELDSKGVPVKVYIKEYVEMMAMIEDFMLLANREVAEYIWHHAKKKGEQDTTFIYRIHDVPDPERIEELALFLRAVGYDLKHDHGKVTSVEINKLLSATKGTPEEATVHTATLRAMAKAVYSAKNIGHFSLGFKHYTHFTSPIRRYPDIMAHRILASHLANAPLSKGELAAYKTLAVSSSLREVEAVRAERDSTKLKQTEYMSAHIGETFDGVVTGVTDWGMFVAEKNTKAEGLIRSASLKDDYYDFDKKNYALVGRKTKKKYRLGDVVRMTLVGADPQTRQIDWKLA